jgi:uncharacterized membrane protein
MSEMIVGALKYESAFGKIWDKLVSLQKPHLLSLANAAVLVRKQDGKMNVKQAVSLVGSGALGWAFWGTPIGLQFFAP